MKNMWHRFLFLARAKMWPIIFDKCFLFKGDSVTFPVLRNPAEVGILYNWEFSYSDNKMFLKLIMYIHCSRFIFVQFVSLFCNSIPVIVSAQRDFVLKREHVLQKGDETYQMLLGMEIGKCESHISITHTHMGNWHHDCWKSRCPMLIIQVKKFYTLCQE